MPLIIAGVVILGFIFLIVLVIFVSRRVTITMKTGGAVALTLASILLLSGLWCMFLSPTMTYSETKESFHNRIPIQVFKSWSYNFSLQKGDTLYGSADGLREYNAPEKAFNIYIYDPDGNIIWSETNISYTYFNIKALKSGLYRFVAQNPNPHIIGCYIQITVSAKVTYRPLEPVGQWLSLISLPVFGLGMWASGVFALRRKKIVKPVNSELEGLV